MVASAVSPSNICKQLNRFGYNEQFSEAQLSDILQKGIYDQRLTCLLVWLCNEISTLYELGEQIQIPSNQDEDFECYLLELSSLLNELECPVDVLTTGSLNERFGSVENLGKLLQFLIGHLQCARLTALDRLLNANKVERYFCLQKREEVVYVENALRCLNSVRPPSGLTAKHLFSHFCKLVVERLAKCKEKPKPLYNAVLTETQWGKVEKINERLVNEYYSRMQLLLKRLDVTIQSFIWSDRIKKIEDKVYEVYRPRRDNIFVSANVAMDDLLAASTDLLIVEKVMSLKQRERTASRLNKVLMDGRPGDRGGRPSELRAPPPEIPSWQKSSSNYSRGNGRNNFTNSRGKGNYNRVAGFENQVMHEYEAAVSRQRDNDHFAENYQGGGYRERNWRGNSGYNRRGRGGGYGGSRGGSGGYNRY
uniref:Protein FAM98A n=1 Tax=Syphacia muris TaxID=451379 RepID=A0A0N5AIC6_9BILA